MRFVQAGTMLLGAVIYLVIVLYFANGGEAYFAVTPLLVTVGVWNVLLFIVTMLVIRDGVRKIQKGLTAQLATSVFVVKLAAIPFFIMNFALMALIGFMGMMIFLFGGFALMIAAVISVGLTYLAMLSTSVYGFAHIMVLHYERRITTVRATVYTIMLCIFVVDILAGILLFVRSRRDKTAIVAAQGASIES